MALNKSIRSTLIPILVLSLIIIPNAYSQPKDNATLEPTFNIRTIDGVAVPFQNNFPDNNFPVPSFEKQNREVINLAGKWKKLRFTANHDLSLQKRTQGVINDLGNIPYQNIPGAAYNDAAWVNTDNDLPFVENKLAHHINEAGDHIPEVQMDGGNSWNGGVWYRRNFQVTGAAADKKLYKLIFYSVNYVCDVWVNGQYAGYHEGGYTPFAFDISDKINYSGGNVIAIRVDAVPLFNLDGGKQNQNRYDIVPCFGSLAWFNYGGVIHDVYLEVSNAVSVMRADVEPLDINGNIRISTTVFNNSLVSKNVRLTMELFNANPSMNIRSEKASDIIGDKVGSEIVSPMTLPTHSPAAIVNTFKIPNPKLWFPNDPNLYVLKVTVRGEDGAVLDEYCTQFGIRTLRVSGHNTLLNNDPVFLTGIARHEDSYDYGRSMPVSKIFDDLSIIKDTLYCNFLRTGHYPNHPYTYIIADRLGLATAEEVPVCWFSENEWTSQARRNIDIQMFREVAYRDYNRPSVLFWSAGNECHESDAGQPKRIKFIQDLRNDINTYYPDGRILMQSADPGYSCENDASQDYCDAVGWTMWLPRTEASLCRKGVENFLNDCSSKFSQKPIIVTEFGGGGVVANSINNFAQEFDYFEKRAVIDTKGVFNPSGYVTAVSFWIAFDFFSTDVFDGNPTGHINKWGAYSILGAPYPIKDAIRTKYGFYSGNGGVYLH